VFERCDNVGEVEQLLMATMEDNLQRERQRHEISDTNMRIYRNYVSVLIDLCRRHDTVESVAMFGRLYTLPVLSWLFFPRRTRRGGVGCDVLGRGCGRVDRVHLDKHSVVVSSRCVG